MIAAIRILVVMILITALLLRVKRKKRKLRFSDFVETFFVALFGFGPGLAINEIMLKNDSSFTMASERIALYSGLAISLGLFMAWFYARQILLRIFGKKDK